MPHHPYEKHPGFAVQTRRALAACLATLAILAAMRITGVTAAQPAFAEDLGSDSSSCTLSDADREAYAADGSLDDRIAYMESLGHDSANSSLIEQAQQRESGVSLLSAVPSSSGAGMPTTGTARVLGVCVEFQDLKFDDAEAQRTSLQQIIEGGGTSTYPYESLQAYYQRASYGKLSIQCDGVLVYTAQHDRSYYTNDVLELFWEVARAIDDNPEAYGNIDFSNLDANHDGYVDGFYLMFAGQSTGWGSVWWPTERNIDAMAEKDRNPELGHGTKVKLSASVLLKPTGFADTTTRTIIHETGHMLGLPDYYSYTQAGGSTGGARGIGTLDMMDNNIGDHNAFSKWLLGWFDENDITRVYVSEDGIKIRQGSNIFESEESIEQALEALDYADLSKTGGFVAVSNDEKILESLFCSFYMLQYDQPTGNQSKAFNPSRSGVRIYRVQASLWQDNFNFEKSNNYADNQHDQLIESIVPASNDQTGVNYANFFDEGACISPSTTPSTNFLESVAFGYSGIRIDVGTSEQSQGTVRISWQSAPDAPEFAITAPEGFQLSNMGTFTLDMTAAAQINYECGASPKLVVDGVEHGVTANLTSGSTEFSFSISLNPGIIQKSSKCAIVFPEGYFITGSQGDAPTYSSEITVPLPVGDLADIDASGIYENLDTNPGAQVAMSRAFNVQETSCFIRAEKVGAGSETRFELSLCALSNDGTACEKRRIDTSGIELGVGDMNSIKLQAIALGDNIAVARLSNANDAGGTTTYIWIDTESGNALASKTLAYESPSSVMLAAQGALVIASSASDDQTHWNLVRYVIDHGTVLEAYAEAEGDSTWPIDRVFNAGNGLIAFSNNGYLRGTTVKLYSENDIASLFGGNERTASRVFADLEPVTTATLGNETTDSSGATIYPPLYPCDVQATENGIYVAYAQNMYDEQGRVLLPKPRVVKFASDGTPQWDTIIAKAERNAAMGTFRLDIASNGAVSLSSWGALTDLSSDVTTVYLLDDSGSCVGSESSQGGTGAWIGRAWLSINTAVEERTDPADGSWAARTHWFRSNPIGSEPQPDPTPVPDPSNPTPASTETGNTSSGADAATAEFAKTGDNTLTLTIAAALALLAATTVLASAGGAIIAITAHTRSKNRC